MNPVKKNIVVFGGLLVYTLALTAALLYFRFPAEKAALFCQTKMELIFPKTQCAVEKLSYSFPLSVTVHQMDFKSNQGKKENLCRIDQLTISPQLSSLNALSDIQSAASQLNVEINAWDGVHSFSLLLNPEEQQFSMEEIRFDNLNLAQIPFLQQTFGREITGSFSGSGSYRGGWSQKRSVASGEGKLTIDRGTFSLIQPILSLDKIDLKKLTADLVLKQEQLQFSKGSFHGEELKGEFSGDVTLQSPLKRSAFSFKGTLEPLPPLLKKSKYAQNMVLQLKKQHARATLPFALQGSVERPKFKFDS